MRTLFSTIFQSRYLSALLLVAIVVLASCKKDDPDPTPEPDDLTAQQERAQALEGTWASTDDNISAPEDTEDAALQELQALTMTFGVTNSTDLAPGSFSAAGAPTYFSAGSGATWAWANADPDDDAITLNAVGPVSAFSITAFDGSTMTIVFDFEGPATGRVEGVGEYTVQMTKQ